MSSLDPADDNLYRCFGNKPGQVEYAAYHDDEWGIPCHDDQHLFEMLVLEGTQAGLSWETVLKKRRAYRLAFSGRAAAGRRKRSGIYRLFLLWPDLRRHGPYGRPLHAASRCEGRRLYRDRHAGRLWRGDADGL